MSGVAAVMLVKDEADVINYTLIHLAGQVDGIYVSDNGSTDGTREILDYHERESGVGCLVYDDPDLAYYQADKTTALARKALEAGFDWVVPCDADEFWRCHDPSIRIADALAALGPEYVFARADLYDHKVTPFDDPDEPNPYRRMGWRFREPGKLPKVAVRLSRDIEIGMGNHDAKTQTRSLVSSTGSPPSRDGILMIEHYSWRSADQLVRKIRNGYRAYEAAPGLGADYGTHWKQHGDPDHPDFEGNVREWFARWAYSADPYSDDAIGYFPAPPIGSPVAGA